jgi:uncharacterized protein YbjT (DUF2867 family)
MPKILVTDAVGLVGAYIIQALLAEITTRDIQKPGTEYCLLAGYHTEAELQAAKKSAIYPDSVIPILVDWGNENTYHAAVKDVDAILLLTPFTSKKVDQIESWLKGISTATRSTHVVHVGIHTADKVSSNDRPGHETWQLEAEAMIASVCKPSTHLSYTFLRINFDGYNTLLKPGTIAYYIPQAQRYGWIAREDIAALAGRVLLEPARHSGKVYVLSAEALSLDDMASVASEVTGKDIAAQEIDVDYFEEMALVAVPGDEGYAAYIRSVAGMFRMLAEGGAVWHREAHPDVFQGVVGRRPLTFRTWLEERPTMRSRLGA